MNEEKKLRLTVASSPHVASPIDTTNLMRDVLIALVPAMVMGVVFFGPPCPGGHHLFPCWPVSSSSGATAS